MQSYKWEIIIYPDKESQESHKLRSSIVWGKSRHWHTNKIECEKEGLSQIIDMPARWGGPDVYITVLEATGHTWCYKIKKSFP